jgi:fatty acid desaturase
MWNIHGKTYDLTTFAERHPGGAEIIEKTKGLEDCTPLFESYHAFSDISSIQQSLAKYEVEQDAVVVYTGDFSTYHQLLEKIREIFPDRDSIKAPPTWYIYSAVAGLLYVWSLSYLLTCNNVFLKCLFAILAATLETSLLFNVLHDASHFAITSNSTTNTAISKIAQNWTLWNHPQWLLYHVCMHHSFTGNDSDPDKHLYDYAKVIDISQFSPAVKRAINGIVFAILPGQHTMQSILYAKRAIDKYPNTLYYTYYDGAVILAKWSVLFMMGLWPALLYMMTLNTLYYINVIPDHDQYETHENHYEGSDWAKQQICNSGNFVNGYRWWSVIFGGINHQIEHHLFPNMSSYHYPTIAPIVKAFCKANDIPYAHQSTFEGTYKSCMKRLEIS